MRAEPLVMDRTPMSRATPSTTRAELRVTDEPGGRYERSMALMTPMWSRRSALAVVAESMETTT